MCGTAGRPSNFMFLGRSGDRKDPGPRKNDYFILIEFYFTVSS